MPSDARYAGMVMDGPKKGERLAAPKPWWRVPIRRPVPVVFVPHDDAVVSEPVDIITYVFLGEDEARAQGRLPGWWLE